MSNRANYMIQNDSNSTTMINKYKLNKEGKDFINEIALAYKHEIVVIEKDLAVSEHGWSYIKDDVPTIEIDSKSNDKEDILIHEAYHIILKYIGFPSIRFEYPNTDKSDRNIIYLNWFGHLFWDKIEHYYFYPLMLSDLKMNPYNSLTIEIKEAISKGKIEGLQDATRKTTLAGYYLQVWIEINDDKILKEFEDFLITKYNGEGITQGKELISIFKNNKISNSNDAISLFIKCFNLIHKSQNLIISTTKIEKEQHKNYTQIYAYFIIKPL